MRLDRDWIAAHIPHKGTMCLLEEVLEWGPGSIRCRATAHRDPGNPLRSRGRLGAACGIEYAAQAMAVHGALLLGSNEVRAGKLASARGVTVGVARLDDCAGDLTATAHRIHGDAAMVLYDFTVADGSRVLLAGRATIAFTRQSPLKGADEDDR